MDNVIYVDGHCNGRNGLFEVFPDSGYTMIYKNGAVRKIEYKKKKLTNNEAELLAIAHACLFAPVNSIIKSDSRVAIGMAKKGRSNIKNDQRFLLLATFIKTVIEIKQLKIEWTPREENPIT